MRSILEKAIVHLLNDEQDKAENLFHQFMVSRAKQIHESLRQGGEAALDENWAEEIKEEYFTEEDLTGVEDEAEGAEDAEDEAVDAEDGAEDAEVGAQADAGAVEDETADVEDDVEGLEGEEDVEGDKLSDVEDRLADIEDKIAELTADFEQKMADSDEDLGDLEDLGDEDEEDLGDFGFGDETDQPVDAEPEAVDHVGAEVAHDDLEGHEGEEEVEHDPFAESDEFEDEDLNDITESVIAELEKVAHTITDGEEVGAGKTATINRKSNLTQKKASADDAKPVPVKFTKNDSFERETAPTSKRLKKTDWNNADNAGKFQTTPKSEKGALLKKDFANGAKNDKSLID